MAATISATDRERLAKLLGMLGSDHDGERAAAALAAAKFVRKLGLTWPDVVGLKIVEQRLPELGTWRQTVADCLAHPGSLRPWKLGFLRDLPKFRRLSVKQRYCLREIADRVLQRSAA